MGISNRQASQPIRWRLPAMVVGLMMVAVFWWLIQTKPVLQQDGYDIAVTLYGVCNRRNAEQLEQLKLVVEERSANGQLQVAETATLNQIIATAEAGQWREAMVASHELLTDQVNR